MALVGLSLEATREFRSKFDPDRDGDNATVFVLGTLDSRVHGKIRDMATSVKVDPSKPDQDVETIVNGSEVSFNRVSFGLRGVRNLRDKNGSEIAFTTVKRNLGGRSYEVASPEFLRHIPDYIIQELGEEIGKDNEVPEGEAKN